MGMDRIGEVDVMKRMGCGKKGGRWRFDVSTLSAVWKGGLLLDGTGIARYAVIGAMLAELVPRHF